MSTRPAGRNVLRWGVCGVLLAAVLGAGCIVSILTEPSGADVYLDEVHVGVSPCKIQVSVPGMLKLTKKGYDTLTQKVVPTKPTVKVKLKGTGETIIEVKREERGTVIVMREVHAEEDVIENSPNVSAVRRVTDLGAGQHAGGFCVLPDGALVVQILEQVKEEGSARTKIVSNFWGVPPTGSGLRRITQGNFLDRHPAADPTEPHLYFCTDRARTAHIWRLNVEGAGGLAMVTRGTTTDWRPSVSPDGLELIYIAYMKGSKTPQIWVTPLGGGYATQLREGDQARWSPYGEKIVFVSVGQRKAGEIWVVNRDGSEPTQLTTGESDAIHPRWSDDGSKIILADNRGVSNEKHNYDIWVMDADGGNPIQLTTNGSRDDHPCWGLDGKTVYFRSNRGKKWDIWAMEMK